MTIFFWSDTIIFCSRQLFIWFYLSIYLSICLSIYLSVYMYVYIYIHIHVICIYIYIYIYIYMCNIWTNKLNRHFSNEKLYVYSQSSGCTNMNETDNTDLFSHLSHLASPLHSYTFPTFPAHYFLTFHSWPPFQWQINPCKTATFFY